MGSGYTNSQNRTNGRRVAMAMLTFKSTKATAQATSEVGASSGDSQINWITPITGPDRSNAHVAVFESSHALISWEEIESPDCDFIAMGCSGAFSGTYFQLVNTSGQKIGDPITSNNTYVAGDMVTMAEEKICWPYVSMDWDLSAPVASLPDATKKMSFACMILV